MGKVKSFIMDIEEVGLENISEHQRKILDHMTDDSRYAVMSAGRQMGKSRALGMSYGAGPGKLQSMWSMFQEYEIKRKQEKLARETELGAILYGKETAISVQGKE